MSSAPLNGQEWSVVTVNGENYQCQVYDVASVPISIRYLDDPAPDLQKHRWLLPAIVTNGISSVDALTDEKISAAFELLDPDRPKKIRSIGEGVRKQITDPKGGYDKDAQITIKSLVLVEMDGDQYLVVKTSTNLAKGTNWQGTIGLIKVDGLWKRMAPKRDPDGKRTHILSSISQECEMLAQEGRIKRRALETLK